jgi:hypothetical protein
MQNNSPAAYIFCYTIIWNAGTKKQRSQDFFNVFDQYRNNQTPKQQAEQRLKETIDFCDDKKATNGELYTWNICKVTQSSEHYTTHSPSIEILKPEAIPSQWDNTEINAIWEDDKANCDVCEDETQASFFSLYLHDVEGGIQCVADCETREAAEKLETLINNAVKNYKDNGHL